MDQEQKFKEKLTKEEYHVLREKGTERPFSGKYYKNKEKGIYHCKACNNPLFSSETKYESGTGWPSFYAPLTKDSIETKADKGLGMTRTEVRCHRCKSHLGHVFDDGPPPTGKRYCINSIALEFEKK